MTHRVPLSKLGLLRKDENSLTSVGWNKKMDPTFLVIAKKVGESRSHARHAVRP